MSIIFVGNSPAQFLADSASLSMGTSTEHRDSDFVPNDMSFTVYEGGSTPFGFEFDTPATDFWLHYRMFSPRCDNFGVMGVHSWLKLFDASDNELLRFEGNGVSNWIDVVGDTTGVGGSFALGDGVSFTVDIHLVVDGTTSITGTLYLNGAKVSTATVANTGGRGGVARVLWENYNTTFINGGANTDTSHVSEVIATSGESTRGWRLAQLNPAAAGALTDFSGTYDTLADGDLASGVSGEDGDRMSNTLTGYNAPATTSGIRAVVAAAVAAKGASGADELTQFLRIGGTNYDGSAVALTEDYASIVQEWANDPSTAAPWDTADFASLELGLLASTAA